MNNQSAKSDWLFRFKKPATPALIKISDFIDQLKISDIGVSAPRRTAKDAAYEGGKDGLMNCLKKSLSDDYSANHEESRSEPWTFEYVVDFTDPSRTQLQILTRLYNPLEAGSVLYGRTLVRLSDSNYILWIDD